MKPMRLLFAVVPVFAVCFTACDPKNPESESQTSAGAGKPIRGGKLSVMTTFYPTQYFAERIGGDLVEVACPVPEDADPIFWMPDGETIQSYQQADLIVLNGASFAKWIDKVSLPQSRIVNSALPLASEFITFEAAVEHSHGKEGSHAHEGIDGHTWLDPLNAKVQAAEIRNAIVLRRPDAVDAIEANYVALAADLDTLHDEFEKLSKSLPPMLASHPAYNYPARRYGWDIENLDLDPDELPTDEQVAEIRAKLDARPASWLFWESEPIAESVALLESELGVKSIVFSPCEMLSTKARQSGVDYLSVMQENLDRLRSVTGRDG